MPTQNVNLSEQQIAFIHSVVKDVDFCNASEVVRAGLRALELQMETDRLKLENLRHMVNEGLAAIDRGEYTLLSAHTIDDFMNSLP